MTANRRIRVLMGKPGLCGHDRGIVLVVMALRDAGMEVIYSGRHHAPEQLVDAAIQEDVDVLGVSVLSGAHMSLCKRITGLLRERGADDIAVLAGGFIPPEDFPRLKELGVREVFREGSRLEEIVDCIRRIAVMREVA
ncbi:MAG: cobalamin B12-binding domain-containing protein [Hyphomicrobiaceae bacterium]|nr:cobalamin B12-binding domain-containing protein [Hyphomicrobiaceae bacterium]